MAEDRVGSIVDPSVAFSEVNDPASWDPSKNKLQQLGGAYKKFLERMSGATREQYVDGLIGALARSSTPVTDPEESSRKAKAFFKQRPRPWRWYGAR